MSENNVLLFRNKKTDIPKNFEDFSLSINIYRSYLSALDDDLLINESNSINPMEHLYTTKLKIINEELVNRMQKSKLAINNNSLTTEPINCNTDEFKLSIQTKQLN